MRKVTNIVMSVLALMAGCTGMLTANVLADTSTNMQSDILHTEPNIYSGWMSLTQIDPANNRIVFIPGDGDGTWGTMRVVFAQENYEAGVTEGEADAKLETLGADEDTRFVTLYDEDTRNRAFIPLWLPIIKDSGLVKNKTDRLYYAVQHGHPVSGKNGEISWEDVWWERGKIDYRGCVHASVYDPNTMLCNQKFSGGAKVTYVVSNNKTGVEEPVPAGESIITWEEEWLQIREERLNELQVVLENLQWNIDNFENIINKTGVGLEKLEVTLNGDQDADLASRVQDLREILKKLQDLMAKYDIEGMKSELEKLKSELLDLREQCATLEEEKRIVIDENKVLESEKQNMVVENEALKVEIAMLKEKLAQKESETVNDRTNLIKEDNPSTMQEKVVEVQMGSNADVSEIITDDRSTENSNMVVKESVQHEERNEQQNVEVPMLGEVENRMSFWWLLLPIVTFVGMAVLAIRRFRRK